MLSNLSAIQMVRKLQISIGDSTRKGNIRLANVIYISAGRKLDRPTRLKRFTMVLSSKAWIIVSTSVMSTFASGVMFSGDSLPVKLLMAGSKNTGMRLWGRCINTPRQSTSPTIDKKRIFSGVYLRNCSIILYTPNGATIIVVNCEFLNHGFRFQQIEQLPDVEFIAQVVIF